jgi:serine protease Do
MKTTHLLAICALLGGYMHALAQPEPRPAPRGRRANAVLQKHGTSYLGVGAADIDAERAKALKLPEERGVELKSIAGDGPAAKAGLKEGDVVLEYNGQRVEGTEQFVRLVRETPPGRQVRLLISRDGNTQTMTLETGTRTAHLMAGVDGFPFGAPIPPVPPMPPMPPDTAETFRRFGDAYKGTGERWWRGMTPDLPSGNMSWRSGALGIESESLGPQLAQFFGVKEGVLVRSVNRNSPAEKAGIKAGDVIVKIAGNAVESPRAISRELRSARSKGNVAVMLVRSQKEMTVTVELPEPAGSRMIVPAAALC